ncbi:MAG TPA: metallophosphoesterase [Glaciihabitans sp.]|jgi:3',5'-cyclic AMP phosphodiesterase CpdA|nr:metallophosphoesterase [Glaciihabitans sp.]
MSLESGKFTVLHLSDVHATTGELLYGQVDTLARLDQVASYALSAGITPEAILVTGDLIQRGHEGAYPAVNAALERLGARLGAPVLTVLGNHDVPASATCLTGHGAGHTRVVHIGPVRFLLLDTSSGYLDQAGLDLLTTELAEPYGIGSVVALHHAPIPSPLPTLSKTGLKNPEALAAAIVGGDVRTMLAGHYHHPMTGTFSGVPVHVGPSLAYHQVMNAGPHTVSGHDLAMFSLVHITDAGVSSAPVSLSAANPLFSSPAPASTAVPSALPV